jgi:hypothetical protein
MARDPFEDSVGLVLSLIILAVILTIAILVSYVILIVVPAYIGYRLYIENPKRLERL